MIKGERKPLPEIRKLIAPYKKVLILGCNTCTAICFAGGEKEVAALASTLRITDGKDKVFTEGIVRRQCEKEYILEARKQMEEADVIVSLACALGVQAVVEHFPQFDILPGLNTSFLGIPMEHAVFNEKCIACGDCIIGLTGGLCPFSRCAKSLFNGPCGGSVGGRCEISKDVPCVWQQILDRLKSLGRLTVMEDVVPIRDWVSNSAKGPRTIVKADMKLPEPLKVEASSAGIIKR